MKVGFTGTQRGMTLVQGYSFFDLIFKLEPTQFHHGDCVGADAQAHLLALKAGIDVVLHPPDLSAKQAFCRGAKEIRQPKPYLKRNHDIVDETTVLIATPAGFQEELRSGTWSTVRYARKLGRPIFIVWPDGSVREENTK